MTGSTMEHTHKDPEHIDVTQERDVKYWTEVFGISEDELRKTMRAAGTRVRDVRSYLESERDRGGRARETPQRRPPRS